MNQLPKQESALRFIFGFIWPPGTAADRGHLLVRRLTELRDTKDDFLADDEYAQIRSTLLEELASRPRMPAVYMVIFLAFIVTGVAGIIYCFGHRILAGAGVPALWGVASTLMWWRMERDYAAKRNLARADRLAAVEELATAGLISADEAGTMKTGIEKLFESERTANPGL